MHEGVVRDMEQLRLKKERQLDFDMQAALEAELKKEQTVRDVTDGGGGGGSAKG
jgi:protein PET117